MPLDIKDDETTKLVAELACRLETTNEHAVKTAVRAELDRLKETLTLKEKLRDFYARFPLPGPTGEKADKAFFDELSGDSD